MRHDVRVLLAAIAVACVLVATQGVALAAGGLQMTRVDSARFPDRSFVLTLPEERAVAPDQVRLTENGADVERLAVSAGAGAFGVVLAIDASQSMHGRAIEDAMSAARAFAARRRPDQPLGVVFFSRVPRVALEPTTDRARIDAVLATAPALTRGTRIRDAARTSVQSLRRAGVDAGSVVVLSDGDDVGSATSARQLSREVAAAGARVYSVGLRSPSYEDAALREIAAHGGGTYAEASSSRDLSGLFEALGERLAGQYVVTYRSLAPLGGRVEVSLSIDGLDEAATAVYEAPAFTSLAGGHERDATAWSSPYAPVALALLVAAIVGFITFWLIGPRRTSVRSRIAGFVSPEGAQDGEAKPARAAVLAGAQRSLRRNRAWGRFAEEVELSRVDVSAFKLAAWTGVGTVGLCYLLGVVVDRPVLALAALGLPLAMRAVVRVKVSRERRLFADQLSENLQVLASAMRAGHSFLGALAVMVDDAGEPSRREFKRVLHEEQLGVPLQDALATVARRMRNSDVEYVGLVAQLQTETGGNTAEVLDRVTETIRERNALLRLVRTLTAQGRLGGWVVSLIPVGLIVALNILNPNYLDPLLETGAGKALLAAGGGCVLAGMLVIRRIVDIKV